MVVSAVWVSAVEIGVEVAILSSVELKTAFAATSHDGSAVIALSLIVRSEGAFATFDLLAMKCRASAFVPRCTM